MAATWDLPNEIAPNYDGGLMKARYLIGGVRMVKTIAHRNAIKYLYRFLDTQESMIVFVEADNAFYKLINNPLTDTTSNTDWERLNLNGVSTFTPIGSWDSNNLDPVLTDAAASGRNGEFYFVKSTPSPIEVTYTNLFGGEETPVVDGNLIVSVGTRWIVVSNSVSWESISKPQSITDYGNGIIIDHTHTASDISDLATYLQNYLKRSDTADHTIDPSLVADTAIIEYEFLKAHYYSSVEVDQLMGNVAGGTLGFWKVFGTTNLTADATVDGGSHGLYFEDLTEFKVTDSPFTVSASTSAVSVSTTSGNISLLKATNGFSVDTQTWIKGLTNDVRIVHGVSNEIHLAHASDTSANLKLYFDNTLPEDLTTDFVLVRNPTTGRIGYRANSNFASVAILQKDVSTTTYTIQTGDENYWIYFTNTSGCTVTIPHTVSAGFTFTGVRATGAGLITFQSNGTSVIRSSAVSLTLNAEECGSTWISKTGTIWYAFGELGTSEGIASQKEVPGTTYTLLDSDEGTWIYFTNAAGCTVTLPHTLTTGFTFTGVRATGAGTITFQGNGTSLLRSTSSELTLLSDEAGATWVFKGSNVWYGFGELGNGFVMDDGNGITITSDTVELGGALTKNTNLDGAFEFRIGDNTRLSFFQANAQTVWVGDNSLSIDNFKVYADYTTFYGSIGASISSGGEFDIAVDQGLISLGSSNTGTSAGLVIGKSVLTYDGVYAEYYNNVQNAYSYALTLRKKLGGVLVGQNNIGVGLGFQTVNSVGALTDTVGIRYVMTDVVDNTEDGKYIFSIHGAGTVTDRLNIATTGMSYNSDHSASNISNTRWIPDKAYVDNAVAGATGTSYTFNNGLTNTSGTVKLGGTLLANTTLSLGAFDFNINGTGDILLTGTILDFVGTTFSVQGGDAVVQLNSTGAHIFSPDGFEFAGTNGAGGSGDFSVECGQFVVSSGEGIYFNIDPGFDFQIQFLTEDASSGMILYYDTVTGNVTYGEAPSGGGTFESGLTTTDGVITLGGALTQNTDITGAFDFGITGITSMTFISSVDIVLYSDGVVIDSITNAYLRSDGVTKMEQTLGGGSIYIDSSGVVINTPYDISITGDNLFLSGIGSGTTSSILYWNSTTGAVTAGAVPSAGTPAKQYITFVVDNSTAITTGEKTKTRFISPYTGTITGWRIIADTSSTLTLDLWKNTSVPTNANSITASAKPALTAASFATGSTLTGWTTAVTAGDILCLEVEANNNATNIKLLLEIQP